jgi:FkbM family methyltransferase
MKSSEKLNVRIRTKEDIFSFENIVLWGAGFALEDCIESIGRENIDAVFDNDRSKWGTVICGFEIKSSETDIEKYIHQNTAVLISTNGYEYEIAKDLMETKGLKEIQLFSNSNCVVEEFRYLPETIDHHVDEILKISERFSDEDSKKYYINFIKACLSRNPIYFSNNPSSTEGYEYNTNLGKVGFHGGAVILDCGAFNGDTARIFMGKTNNDCEVYCFEPVVENYLELQAWIDGEQLTNIHAIHSGVGDSTYIDKVYSTETKTTKAAVGNNRFQAETPVVSDIQVDSIDNMIQGKKVDYIKMDIEGAEMAALRGAKKTIEKYAPQLLISGYHKVTDMWEIPKFVLGINPNYKMFLGHQQHAPYEPEFIFIL